MIKTSLLGTSYVTPLGRLLGGWRDILDDIRQPCTRLNALPEGCMCGDAPSHLSGSCACWNTVQRESARPDGDAIEPRIAAVLQTFDRVSAVDEFRIGCRASHLSVIKQATADLLVDANRLEQHLKELR